MNESAIIEEILMLRAHASQMIITTDNLLKRFDAPKKKKSGLPDGAKAKLLAGRERTRNRI